MSHQVTADQDDQNMDFGRFLQENSYGRDTKKQITVGNVKLDILRQDKDGIVVGEVKKSSRNLKSSRMQLAFYLKELKERGIVAKGELLFPSEKKKEEVVLTSELEAELTKTAAEIERLAMAERPLLASKVSLCKNCAYKEFCWA